MSGISTTTFVLQIVTRTSGLRFIEDKFHNNETF